MKLLPMVPTSRAFRILAILIGLMTLMPLGITAAQGKVEVTIGPIATLITGGQSIFVPVKVICDPFGDVLEAFLTVQQQIYGEGFLNAVQCDGVRHGYLVRVIPFDGVFRPGPANASAFILICDEQDNCIDGQANRTIRIRPSRRMP